MTFWILAICFVPSENHFICKNIRQESYSQCEQTRDALDQLATMRNLNVIVDCKEPDSI